MSDARIHNWILDASISIPYLELDFVPYENVPSKSHTRLEEFYFKMKFPILAISFIFGMYMEMI